ncbi:MAG TPA: acetyltransferase [Pseudomonadales bacterium]
MAFLKGILATTLVALNTIVLCIPLFLVSAVRALSPAAIKRWLSRKLDRWIIDGWVATNRACFGWLDLCDVEVQWQGAERLDRDRWYLVISNHQSWTDILLLQTSLYGHIPPIKFFTKRELIWIPFIGLAMRLLGFPFVRRMTREQIAKKPELVRADRDATLAACQEFRNHPTTVLNFLEGTRFTPAKQARQDARFKHLLNPKIGGLSYVLSGLSKELDRLVDVTITYPRGTPTFWEFMQGKCPAAHLLVQCREIPQDVRAPGNDDEQREVVSPWIEALWREKDARLGAQTVAL